MQTPAERDAQNALLRSYGYRWVKDNWGKWQLLDKSGNLVTVVQAFAGVAAAQRNGAVAESSPETRAEIKAWAMERLNNGAVILDSETTGLGPGAEIIDLAIIYVSGITVVDTLIKASSPIEPGAYNIHGISDAMLTGKPTIAQVWQQIALPLTNREVVIFNAKFDMAMLAQSLKLYDIELPPITSFCLMHEYSRYINESDPRGGYRLKKLSHACQHFGIPEGTHRARSDVEAARKVLMKLATLKGES